MKKIFEFFNKRFDVLLLIVIAISVFSTLTYHLIDGTRNIDDQKAVLFENERIVGTDFSKLQQVDNATLHFEDDMITVKYSAEDCTLSVTYNQNLKIVSKQLEDLRIWNNPVLLFGSIVCTAILSLSITFILLILMALIIIIQGWINKKKSAKNAKKIIIQK